MLHQPSSNPKSILESTAIQFLSYRPRFKVEVANRLIKKADQIGFVDSYTLINQIIESLEKSGFINDQKNLENFIRNRIETKMKGPLWIKFYLLRLGLSKTDIEKSLRENVSHDLQINAIRRYIQKKTTKINLDLKAKAKLYRALIGRGFSASIISETLSLYD